MNELAKEWIEALRSGEYKQGQALLKHKDHFCCLGVLCDISKQGEWVSSRAGADCFVYNEDGFVINGISNPLRLVQQVGLTGSEAEKLMEMNDSGNTFDVIANHIEKILS